MQRLISLLFIITLVSCGANRIAVTPESATVLLPKLNSIQNTEIGNSLVWKEKGYTYNAIKITRSFQIKQDETFKTIQAGQVFINDYSTDKYDLYSYSSDVVFGIAIPKSGEAP